MGDRGYNAGGFAYMKWLKCRCGRKFVTGNRNTETRCWRCRRGIPPKTKAAN